MSVAPAIRTDGYALIVSPYAPEMFPQPTTATRSACSDTAPCLGDRELLPELREHAAAFGGRVAVVRLVLDGQCAHVAEVEESLDAVRDPRTPLSVHAGHVRAGLLDVLQVDVE